VKNHIKLWDSLKKKEITVIIKVNWGWRTIKDYTTEKNERRRKKRRKRINLSIKYISVFISHCFLVFLLTNIKEQLQWSIKRMQIDVRSFKDMSYKSHVIVTHYWCVTRHASTTATTVCFTMTFMKFLTLMSLMHDQYYV
jgi:hypothetical protein